MAIYFNYLRDGCSFVDLYNYVGDADSYIGPHDNLLESGAYFYQADTDSKKILAGRMPHYAVIYYLLRLLCNKPMALNIVVLFQLLIQSTAIVLASLLAFSISSQKNIFWATYTIFILGSWFTHWSIQIAPESLSISFLVVTFYFYYKYLKEDKTYAIVMTSLFISLLVCLKPYLSLLLPFLYLHYLLIKKPTKTNTFIRPILWSVLFLFLFLGPWIMRNYVKMDRFIPFQQDLYAGYNYSPTYIAYRDFLGAWGGSTMFWDKRSAGCYFRPSEFPCEFVLQDFAFSKSYGEQEIEKIRKDFIIWQNTPNDSLEKELFNRFTQLRENYISERPFQYHIASRLRLIKSFILHSGSYFLPINKNSSCYTYIQTIFKYGQSMLYYFILVLGGIGLIALAYYKKTTSFLVLIPIIIIGLFPIILRSAEFRYFNHAYPFLAIGASYIVTQLIQWTLNKVKYN